MYVRLNADILNYRNMMTIYKIITIQYNITPPPPPFHPHIITFISSSTLRLNSRTLFASTTEIA